MGLYARFIWLDTVKISSKSNVRLLRYCRFSHGVFFYTPLVLYVWRKPCTYECYTHTQQWAGENKLSLNKLKSQGIIFRKPCSRGTTDVPIIPGIQRGNSLKIIGVTLCSNFSMQEHISSVISSCVQSLHALRVLKSHGFDDQLLQTVFQTTFISKLQYASSAWWGLPNAANLTSWNHSFGGL